MPRPKYGLGHGLEALVSSRPAHGGQNPGVGGPEPFSRRSEPSPNAVPALQWDYACLAFERRRKRRRLVLVVSHADTRVKPRRHRLRGTGMWTALGVLGAEGWEMVAAVGSTFYFKRPYQE